MSSGGPGKFQQWSNGLRIISSNSKNSLQF
jgi:hypothetical protein